jgi:hypothetical protein
VVVRWTIANAPCTASTADVTITINQAPTTATVGGPKTICASGTTAGLGGNTPTVGSGSWSVVSGGTGTFSPNSTTPGATFTHTNGAGPVVVRWTIANEPCTASTADVTITINQPPTAANDSYNRTAGLSLKIAKTNLLGNDSVGAGFVSADTTTNNITLTSDAKWLYYPSNAPNVSDRFTYTVTNASGCSASAMVYIPVTFDVFGAGGGNATKTATNATVILSGIPGYSYSVQRATNAGFTLGVSNFPSVSAPANGQITTVDDFADLFGTPNSAVPASAFYRLHYTP